MSFQWIIDNAETISMERKKVVASTTSRNGVVRSVSRGAQPWRFEVKLPDGPKWSDYRSYITQAELLDRVTAANIQLNKSGQATWLSKYQGDSVNYTGFIATIVQNSATITLTTSPTTSSGYKFKAGDFIQLGSSGKVYTVAADVAYNSNTVTLHRPVIEASASGVALNVADNCIWSVTCTQFPSWTIFARDQVSWSGPFVFSEVIG
jgi:hypothetical protein